MKLETLFSFLGGLQNRKWINSNLPSISSQPARLLWHGFDGSQCLWGFMFILWMFTLSLSPGNTVYQPISTSCG